MPFTAFRHQAMLWFAVASTIISLTSAAVAQDANCEISEVDGIETATQNFACFEQRLSLLIEEREELLARISTLEDKLPPLEEASAANALRLAALRVTVEEQPFLRIVDGERTEVVPGSDENDFCFIVGIQTEDSNSYTGLSANLIPPTASGPWRIYLSAQNDNGDKLAVRVMCVGLPETR